MTETPHSAVHVDTSAGQANESDHREVSSRTLHTIAALSADVSGLRTEMRADVGRLSSRLLTKARVNQKKTRSWYEYCWIMTVNMRIDYAYSY